MLLSELFMHYGSDKDTNGYSQLYAILFDSLKDKPIRLLEIGIGTMIPGVHSSMVGYAAPHYKPGGSLRSWRDYFSQGEIFGFDVQPDTQFSDEERITTRICDSTNQSVVNEVMAEVGGQFDIIIDDGSHLDMHQFQTLNNFLPYLKENGLYIIEDIYPGSRVSVEAGILEGITKKMPFFFAGFKNNLCIIKKCSLPSKRLSY